MPPAARSQSITDRHKCLRRRRIGGGERPVRPRGRHLRHRACCVAATPVRGRPRAAGHESTAGCCREVHAMNRIVTGVVLGATTLGAGALAFAGTETAGRIAVAPIRSSNPAPALLRPGHPTGREERVCAPSRPGAGPRGPSKARGRRQFAPAAPQPDAGRRGPRHACPRYGEVHRVEGPVTARRGGPVVGQGAGGGRDRERGRVRRSRSRGRRDGRDRTDGADPARPGDCQRRSSRPGLAPRGEGARSAGPAARRDGPPARLHPARPDPSGIRSSPRRTRRDAPRSRPLTPFARVDRRAMEYRGERDPQIACSPGDAGLRGRSARRLKRWRASGR